MLKRLRRENALRSWSVSLLCFVISVMYFGTTIYPVLRGSWIEATIAEHHLIVAALTYGLLFFLVFYVGTFISIYNFKRLAPRRIRSRFIVEASTQLSRKLAIKPLLFSFGNFEEKRIVATSIRSKSIVLIGAGVLPLAAVAPGDFAFRLAHELTHLAANDYRADRIVRTHYVCFAVLMGISLADAVYGYIGHAIRWIHIISRPGMVGSGTPMNAILSGLASSLEISSLFGLVLTLLLLERIATRRSRELHADGIASRITKASFPTFGAVEPARKTNRIVRSINEWFAPHPDRSERALALEEQNPFTRMSKLFLVTHCFLLSYFIDVTLQLVSSDARHRAMLIAWRWRDEPIAVFTPSLVAGLFYIASTHMMVSRVTLAGRGEGKFSFVKFVGYLACAIAGAVLMILTSQSIWYSWRPVTSGVVKLWTAQWDLFLLLAASSLAVAVALGLATTFGNSKRSFSWVSVLPISIVLATALGIAIATPTPPAPCTERDYMHRSDC
ncbi:M48 family metalloprotease [Bradyrhizobium sp. Pa8]|uniref:M48 family metalloprotease n=1 Tax=Bradyrhizobium sp. Pa8 TaxID=3386552 RepID=UPI00403F3DD9